MTTNDQIITIYNNIFYTFANVTNRGASKTRAEIIPSEPDPDNAGVGKEYYNPLGFLLLIF